MSETWKIKLIFCCIAVAILPLSYDISLSDDIPTRTHGTHKTETLKTFDIEMFTAPSGTSPKKATNTIGMAFVYIAPGTFMMGSPESEKGRNDNERQHKVTLTKGYYLQTTEVTQRQWETVMGSNPSKLRILGVNCPVEQVSWDDAQKFIQKLNQRESGMQYRLPTEAEWEYAARAGGTNAFSNGDITKTSCEKKDRNLDAMGWYCYNANGSTHPVADKKPNAWGLYDMHGNVWEWCQDWYDPDYSNSGVTDPKGPLSGAGRVFRGGGWGNYARHCRSAYRYGGIPGNRFIYVGFRLAASLISRQSDRYKAVRGVD